MRWIPALLAAWLIGSVTPARAGAGDPVGAPRPAVNEVLRVEGAATAIPAGRDPLTGLDRYTAGDLWDLAGRAFDASQYPRALALYERLLQQFPEADTDGGARYNAALAAEKALEPSRAGDHYLAYLAAWPDAADRAEVGIAAGRVLIAAGRAREARAPLDAAIAAGFDEEAPRFEARLLRAQVDIETGELDAAERALSDLAGKYRGARRGTLYSPWHGAMARFLSGELARARAESVRFGDVDDRAAAEAQLERKARFVLDAQHEYLECIRLGVRDWVAPAGFRLGEIYRRFRADVIGSPSPRGLTPEDEALYREVLREQTTVLLIKARECYRRVLDRAAQVNIRGEWIERMRVSLREIDGQLLAERVMTDI